MRGRGPSPLAGLGVVAAVLAGCAGPGPGPEIAVLQLNLCNSGIAGCYTGRAAAEAAEVISAERPDVVTLNEVCEDDVPALRRSLAGTGAAAFQPASDRRTGRPWLCRNGQRYGIGVISRWPAVPGSTGGGIYPTQDRTDPEDRAWLCLDVLVGQDPGAAGGTGRPAGVCTTHLADTSPEVATAQCRHLFDTVVPSRGVSVVAGDLNLGSGAIRGCAPAGSARVDDGGRQHLVAIGSAVTGHRTVDLRGGTDHPGLSVTLTVDRR